MVDIVGYEKSLSEDDYDEFLKNFNSPLPIEFKNYYMIRNGGGLSEEEAENEVWLLPVHGFNPIKYGKLPIEKLAEYIGSIATRSYDDGVWKKGNFVPFAYDEGGNSIFLSLRESDYGYIYLYAFDGDNLIHISSDFSSFLKQLYGYEFIL